MSRLLYPIEVNIFYERQWISVGDRLSFGKLIASAYLVALSIFMSWQFPS